MKQLKWGFIGCGEVTEKKSGPAFSEVEGSCVEAVMSRTEQRARTYAIEHGIRKWYTDAQELIDDPDVNAIYVATPPSSHATYAIMAMKAGKPVYVEKPLAASYDDCARINRISEQTGIPCFVAYYRRYLPYFQKVKDIVQSGKIGKILNVQIRYTEPVRAADVEAIKNGKPLAWRLQPDVAGGGSPIGAASMRRKTLSAPVSDSRTACLVVAHGAMWPMRVPVRTVLRSSAQRDR